MSWVRLLYKSIALNPNSTFHLSMKLNYPNEYDLKYAQLEGRDQPGTDIFIHGKAASVGCLAMGDELIEKLFTLVAQVGMENVQVLIAPHNPQLKPLVATANMPSWTHELYETITAEYLRITQRF